MVLTVIAALIRAYRLDYWPLFIDEWLSVGHAKPNQSYGLLYSVTYQNPIPWIIHWTTFRLFGDGALGVRIGPYAFGVTTIPVVWYIGRRLGGRLTGFWAAAFLTLAPWHVNLSQFARHYTLQMLLALLLFYYLYRALEINTRRDYLFVGVIGILLVLTRPSSVYMFVVVLAYVGLLCACSSLRSASFQRRGALWIIAVMALLSLFAYYYTTLVYTDTEAWGRSAVNVLASAGYQFTPTALVAAAVVAFVGIRERNRLVLFLALYAFLPLTLIAITAAVHLGTGIVAFLSLPGILLLIAWGGSRAYERLTGSARHLVTALLVGILATFATQTALYFTVEHGHRPRVHDAAEYLATQITSDDALRVTSGAGTSLFVEKLAERGLHPSTAGFYPTSTEPQDFDPYRRTWFVVEDLYSTWNIPMPAWEWVREHASLVHMVPSYFGPRSRSLWIYRYDPPQH